METFTTTCRRRLGGDFAGKAAELGLGLARLADGMAGSFAAEHGLGRAKIALADAVRSDAERQLMVTLKQALDPENLLNPGVITRMIDK